MSRKGKESSQEGNSVLCRKYQRGEYVLLHHCHEYSSFFFFQKCVNKLLNPRPRPTLLLFPAGKSNLVFYFKSQTKHQKHGNSNPSSLFGFFFLSFYFVLRLLLSLSGCHRGRDQLRTTFESGSLKQPPFPKKKKRKT